MIRPDTVLIHCESPGSLTFEVQDLPAIRRGAGDIPITIDNTWAAGVCYKPLSLGATVSIQSATKYMGGHSDVFLGTVASLDEKTARRIGRTATLLGNATSPDEGETGVRDALGADTYERLETVKTEWDPENVFHLNPNVSPAT